ncbi:hypothetical protein BLS_005653, partial [Venturia inaequalis]
TEETRKLVNRPKWAKIAVTPGANLESLSSPYDRDYIKAHSVNGKPDWETRQRITATVSYQKYILDKAKISPLVLALGLIFDEILVRHNYTSLCPPGDPEYSISKKLPKCIRSTKRSEFIPEWKSIFLHMTHDAYERIRMPIDKKDGRGMKSGTMGVNDRQGTGSIGVE